MADVLIAFSTVEGQTQKIATFIADELKKLGHVVHLRDVRQLRRPGPLGHYGAVLVGGPVHASGYPAELLKWASAHADELGGRPAAFFSVCLGILQKNDPKAQADVRQIMQSFFEKTRWFPARTTVFAGGLAYSKYGLLKRQVMRWIAWRAGGDTDAKKDYEYTDWNEVRSFARNFGAECP